MPRGCSVRLFANIVLYNRVSNFSYELEKYFFPRNLVFVKNMMEPHTNKDTHGKIAFCC